MAKKVYVIGIGGTGMRCLESFVHTCAIGMYDNTEVEMLALDTDRHNGNFERLRSLVNCYKAVNGGNTKSDTFFSAKITYYEFSPNYTNQSFHTISDYRSAADHRTDSPVADLIDLFVDEDVRNMNLEHGYRAQTQMGSMLMYYNIQQSIYEAKVERKSNGMEAFLDSLGKASKAPVFVFGSVFGGTGASTIPILPLALKKASSMSNGNGTLVSDNYFGTMILTNYFNFSVDQMNNKEVIARSDNFAINSQSALTFYAEDETVQNTYRRMYLLGRSLKEARQYSKESGKKGVTGGEEQRNPADYIELLAASAAYNFFKLAEEESKKGPDAFKDGDKFFYIAHDADNEIMDFSLFGQENGDMLKKKMGVAVVASLLDLVSDFFKNIVTTSNVFDNVDSGSEQFNKLKEYWRLFNLSEDSNGNLVRGWLPQMYYGKGGQGILFKDIMFQCKTLKDLKKFKYNKDLFVGDQAPQFNVGLLEDRFDVVKKTFNSTLVDRKTTMDDLLARTYATLVKLYFKE
ncbi:MAG: hypothetical protein ACI3ZQ_03810 [Candidatus Cryptobacteroides sp.]